MKSAPTTYADARKRLTSLAIQAVDHAQRLGAHASDALIIASDSTSICVRRGMVESIERKESNGLGLRVFVMTPSGPSFATASTDDLSDQGLKELAEQTMAMARLATADPDAVPPVGAEHPDTERLRRWERTHPIQAPWDLERAKESALQCEETALAHPAITNSDGAESSYGQYHVAYASSDGFSGSYSRTEASLAVSVIAGKNDGMQRDHAWHRAPNEHMLRSPADLGKEAAERTVRRLGASPIESCPLPVIFEPRTATTLASHFLSAINGRAVLQHRSFLADKLHQSIFPSMVNIDDRPDHPRGLGNRLFDGEGTLCRPCKLVENGRLNMFLADRYAAKRLKQIAQGHARRGLTGDIGIGPSNLIWQPGDSPTEVIFQDLQRALLVTELIGFGVNPTTGDYSRGAAGFLIEKGEITRPVQGVTIAGNLCEMFAHISHIGNDLTWFGSMATPTIAIASMSIAGQS
ncbi:MAG: TldD/PmbA family protein [Zetaproteobacteria bacterium]|nr:MAG: TldD/PmbA family protein [Zetaproteobacteria bacterium]